MGDHAVKRALRSVGADMQFVEHCGLEVQRFPAIGRPTKRTGVHNLRWAVHAVRLPAGCRVRPLVITVQAIEVGGLRRELREVQSMKAFVIFGHREQAIVRRFNMQLGVMNLRRPNAKSPYPVGKKNSAGDLSD